MKAIWKYNLETTDIQEIPMPAGAELLTVQTQEDSPMLWSLVDTDAPRKQRKIRIIGTGNPIEDNFTGIYIGTYQLCGGRLIFHVFETLD